MVYRTVKHGTSWRHHSDVTNYLNRDDRWFITSKMDSDTCWSSVIGINLLLLPYMCVKEGNSKRQQKSNSDGLFTTFFASGFSLQTLLHWRESIYLIRPTMLTVKRLAICITRDGSQGIVHYICLCNANKAEPTLALKSRGDITRNPKQGY